MTKQWGKLSPLEKRDTAFLAAGVGLGFGSLSLVWGFAGITEAWQAGALGALELTGNGITFGIGVIMLAAGVWILGRIPRAGRPVAPDYAPEV